MRIATLEAEVDTFRLRDAWAEDRVGRSFAEGQLVTLKNQDIERERRWRLEENELEFRRGAEEREHRRKLEERALIFEHERKLLEMRNSHEQSMAEVECDE